MKESETEYYEDPDAEQAAYLAAWGEAQERKQEELSEIRERVRNRKESRVQAFFESMKVRHKYHTVTVPEEK